MLFRSEYNTQEEIDYMVEQIPQVVQVLREMSPVWYRMTHEK